MPPDPLYLTIAEAADRLRSTRGALYTQRYRGEAPGALCVRVGARLLYSAAGLDAWFAAQLAEATEAVEARP